MKSVKVIVIGFFVFAAFLLWFGIMTFTGQVAIS